MQKQLTNTKIIEALKAMELNIKSPVPLYIQIGKHIISLINKGILKPGDRIPSVTELDNIVYSNLGRVTIVNALKTLVKDGYLKSKHGKGYFLNHFDEEQSRIALILPLFSVYLQIYAKFAAKLQILSETISEKLWIFNSNENANTFIEACEEAIYKCRAKVIVAIPPYDKQTTQKVDQNALNYLRKVLKSKQVEKVIIFDREVNKDFVSVVQDRIAGKKLLISLANEQNLKTTLFLMNYNYEKTVQQELIEYGKEQGINILFGKCLSPEKNLKLAIENKVEAVFFDGDIYATRLLSISEGKLPFKIAGYDATYYSQLHQPKITSVDPGFIEGAEIIFKLITNRLKTDKRVFKMQPFIAQGETL